MTTAAAADVAGHAAEMSSRFVARPNPRSCLRGREGRSRCLRSKDKETTMPELLIDFITSLDGYAAAEGWPGWWGSKDPSTSRGWESSQRRTTRS